MAEELKQQVHKTFAGMVPLDAPSVFGAPVMMRTLHHDPLKSLTSGGIHHLSQFTY